MIEIKHGTPANFQLSSLQFWKISEWEEMELYVRSTDYSKVLISKLIAENIREGKFIISSNNWMRGNVCFPLISGQCMDTFNRYSTSWMSLSFPLLPDNHWFLNFLWI